MNTADRQRLTGAVLGFAASSARCTAKRLFVSLYLLDVFHFQRAGRSVTGLEYSAGFFGPYPHQLAEEIRGYIRPDLAALVFVEHVPGMANNDVVHALRDEAPLFDLFSPRERAMMDAAVAAIDAATGLLDAVQSNDNGAWANAVAYGKHTPIHLEDSIAIDAPNRAEIIEQALRYRARDQRLRALAA